MDEKAKQSEVLAFEQFVNGNRNAVFSADYEEEVQRLEKENPNLREKSDMTKEQLKKNLEGYIAYR